MTLITKHLNILTSGVLSEVAVTMAENPVQIKALKSILNNIQSNGVLLLERLDWIPPDRIISRIGRIQSNLL